MFGLRESKAVDISRFEHLYPFESHFVPINGFNYHYVDEGAGEPVVMIHGNPTWSFYFRRLIQAFSSRFRAIAVDHIGCGLSDKPPLDHYAYTLRRRVDDLNAFMEIMAFKEKVTLVVHDWGGMIGVIHALEHLDRIRRLIVLNTAAFFPPGGKSIPLRIRLVRDFPLFSKVSVLGLNLFARSALVMASCKKLPRDVKCGLIAPYNCWNNRIATWMFVRDIPLNATDAGYHLVQTADQNLYRLRHLPMLICWGMQDFVFNGSYLAEWRKRFPNADVQTFQDAGHYVLEDVPRKVIDRSLGFMLTN